MKEFAKAFYKGKAWRRCRESYIATRINYDGGLCERCHRVPGYIVHHKTYLTPQNINDPDITLNFCNLEYVCHDCHDREHYSDMHGTATRLDENGRIIPDSERL